MISWRDDWRDDWREALDGLCTIEEVGRYLAMHDLPPLRSLDDADRRELLTWLLDHSGWYDVAERIAIVDLTG